MRVLIVDDSPAMRGFVRRVFLIAGFEDLEFLEAGNGEQALALLRQEPADLILTDIHMPTMDGEEFLRRLSKDGDLNSIPVLVVSTDATNQRLEHMLSLGARGYLKKPFYPETLCEEIDRVMGDRHV